MIEYSDSNAFDAKTRMMLAKAIDDLSNMAKFNEEFTGVLHHMVLDLYKQTGKKIPASIKDYKFKSKDPWRTHD